MSKKIEKKLKLTNKDKAKLINGSIIGAIAVVVVLFTVYATGLRYNLAGQARLGAAVLSVNTSSTPVNIGQSSYFDILVIPNGENISFGQAEIVFDPQLIKIDSIEPGNFFDVSLQNPWFTSKQLDEGRIIFMVAFPFNGSDVANWTSNSETAVFARVNYTALNNGDATISLDDSSTELIKSGVYDGYGNVLLANTESGNLSVQGESDECKADITQDGRVDIKDFLRLSMAYYQTDPEDVRTDMVKDARVDILDFLFFSRNYGKICDLYAS